MPRRMAPQRMTAPMVNHRLARPWVKANARSSRRTIPVASAISTSDKESRRKAAGSSRCHSTVWRGKKVGMGGVRYQDESTRLGVLHWTPGSVFRFVPLSPDEGHSPHHGNHGLFDPIEDERLGEHWLARNASAGGHAGDDVAGNEHGARSEPGAFLPELFVERDPVHARHAEVADDGIHADGARGLEGRVSVVRGEDGEATQLAVGLHARAERRLVVDEEETNAGDG